MRLRFRPPRARVSGFARRAGALLAVSVVGILSAAPPASAHWYRLSGRVTTDCIVPGPNNTYRAVFGYDNDARYQGTIPVGDDNYLTPTSIDGAQIISFKPGAHRAAFATPFVPATQTVTWVLGQLKATATAKTATCGPAVELPPDVEDSGPVYVLAVSLLVIGGVFGARRLRTGSLKG